MNYEDTADQSCWIVREHGLNDFRIHTDMEFAWRLHVDTKTMFPFISDLEEFVREFGQTIATVIVKDGGVIWSDLEQLVGMVAEDLNAWFIVNFDMAVEHSREIKRIRREKAYAHREMRDMARHASQLRREAADLERQAVRQERRGNRRASRAELEAIGLRHYHEYKAKEAAGFFSDPTAPQSPPFPDPILTAFGCSPPAE